MILRFASCRLDCGRHVFDRDGVVEHLEPQVFDLIRVLAEAGGQLLTRDELVDRVWGGLNVSDATISARVSAARRAVGDDGKAQGIIETVPRRGFRLVVPVETEAAEAPAAALPAPPAMGDLPTLAVLPFAYLSQGPDDMLADGIVDEITAALSRVHEFHVIARQSAYALPADRPKGSAAGTLGADYVVRGSIRRSGDRLRIAVELADAASHLVWSERYDERLDDLFALQDRIALQVAGQLPVPLRSAEIARAHEQAATHPDVRALILRAMPQFWAHRPDANARAVELLSEALILDPANTRARAYKAWALIQNPSYMWSDDPAADREAALALAEEAAGTVGDDPPALVAISAAYSMGVAGHSPAIGFARRALAIDPSNAWGQMRLGWALINEDQIDAALAAFDHARRLSPLDPFLFNMNIGTAVAWSRRHRFDLAIPLLEETLLSVPGVTWAYRLLASFHARYGDMDRAVGAAAKLLRAYPGLTIAHLHATLPPSSVSHLDPGYLEGLRRAGIPEN